jgi:myo-inositol 2-dehydrogenase/D-chiro-inositol 1-dehydrogenase
VGGRVAESPSALLGDRLDALLICSPSTTHEEILAEAVRKGIPTFCEKPVATTLDATARLRTLVESTDVPVTIGFQRRSDPGYRALRQRVVSGELGKLYLARMISADEAPPPAEYLTSSGGLFTDQSVHDFDIVRYITGAEIVSVYATGAALTGAAGFAETADIDTAVTVLTLSSGMMVSLTSSRHSAAGYDVTFELAGSSSVATVSMATRRPAADGVADVVASDGGFLATFAGAYRAEIGYFLDFIEGIGDNPCSMRDAYIAFSVAQAADHSRRSGIPVRIDQHTLDGILR